MSVKYTSFIKPIDASLKQKFSMFLRLMEDEVIDISTPKTPKRTGRLRSDILKQVLGLKGKIKWGKDYAARLETMQFKNYTTPGTGPHFAERAVKLAAETKTVDILRKVGDL
jgi:hypothetical protein